MGSDSLHGDPLKLENRIGRKLPAEREFTPIYERNIKRVYQLCFLYLKNHHDAQDAAQMVFEKFLGLHKPFEDKHHEKAWFITVSKNCCKDELKRFWKKKRVDINDLDAAAANEAGGDTLTAALLNLPSKYKDAIYLYYIEGYSVKEMAGLLHRNESTLRNHLSEGRRLLKIDLGGYYE